MSTKPARPRTTNRENEALITGKWKATARFRRDGRQHSMPRRYVHNRGVHRIENEAIQKEIVKSLRSGLEVRLFDDSIRLYHCVDDEYRAMYVAASVMKDSPLRNCVKDIEFEFTHRGEKAAVEDVEDLERDLKAEHSSVHVTPDSMVTCPKCGNRFRVGKALA